MPQYEIDFVMRGKRAGIEFQSTININASTDDFYTTQMLFIEEVDHRWPEADFDLVEISTLHYNGEDDLQERIRKYIQSVLAEEIPRHILNDHPDVCLSTCCQPLEPFQDNPDYVPPHLRFVIWGPKRAIIQTNTDFDPFLESDEFP